MLKSLKLVNVGPAATMELEFGERLNLLTGDNGLGKSFLLDVAWWALTRKWLRDVNDSLTSGYPARPRKVREAAQIEYKVAGISKDIDQSSEYDKSDQSWPMNTGRPHIPGLMIYALADGGFAVWDPARNYWKKSSDERVPAYVFSPADVWKGLNVLVGNKTTPVCNGLIADWASWIREGGDSARRMEAVLAELATSKEGTPLQPCKDFARLSVNDARDIPKIRMGYGQDVPIVYASLAVRRITALAYMLTWAWSEHLIASEQLGQSPSPHVVLLFDEVEGHLHPQWQRRIVPALLSVIRTLTSDSSASVQLIATTHSPLVMASAEPLFDPDTDKVFTLEEESDSVVLRDVPWAKQGDVTNWLVSELFGLHQGRSLEAERAIEAAEAWMRGDKANLPDHLASKEAIHDELCRVLPGNDAFWPRWIVRLEKGKAG